MRYVLEFCFLIVVFSVEGYPSSLGRLFGNCIVGQSEKESTSVCHLGRHFPVSFPGSFGELAVGFYTTVGSVRGVVV